MLYSLHVERTSLLEGTVIVREKSRCVKSKSNGFDYIVTCESELPYLTPLNILTFSHLITLIKVLQSLALCC